MENYLSWHRHSIRLKNFDYSNNGYYYITICINNRLNLLGSIENGIVKLSSFGEVVQQEWTSLKSRYKNINLDEFIVMPNHLHGIIIIKYKSNNSIGDMISLFKARTSRRYNKVNNTTGNKLWQKNYHERIIRNEIDFMNKQHYIINNPVMWTRDELYLV